MLTPIKKQGGEHIYILLQFDIIDWMLGCYMGIYGSVWMLIGSEISYGTACIVLACWLETGEGGPDGVFDSAADPRSSGWFIGKTKRVRASAGATMVM